WKDKWSFESYISFFSEYGKLTEFQEWTKWIKQRKINAKEKTENLGTWEIFQKSKFESDIIDVFNHWSTIDEFKDLYEIFDDFNKWKDEHKEGWDKYIKTFKEEWKEQDIRKFLS